MKKESLEQTVVLIKTSEALRRLAWIRTQLAKSGRIIQSRMVIPTTETVQVLYPHLHPVLIEATQQHLVGKSVQVFVLAGEHVIEQVSQLVGIEVNPELCRADSIRWHMWHEFGCRTKYVGDGYTYYNNFLHCSRSPDEAYKQIAALTNAGLVSFPL